MTAPKFPEGSLISYPREDGLVQHVDWNAYLDSHKHPTWANRWLLLQDIFTQFAGKLSKEQLLNAYYNFANARFMVELVTAGAQLGSSLVGANWLPYDVAHGIKHRRPISDGLTFTSDYPVLAGRNAGTISQGTWAKDIAALIPEWEAMGFWCNHNPPVIRSEFYNLYTKLADLKPETPDNTLPSKPAKPGHELPGQPAKPGHELPVGPTAPDNSLPDVGPGHTPGHELPKPPGHVSGQPLPGEGNRPNQGLPPGAPDRPDNSLPPDGDKPDNALPPGAPSKPDNTLPQNPLPKKTLGK